MLRIMLRTLSLRPAIPPFSFISFWLLLLSILFPFSLTLNVESFDGIKYQFCIMPSYRPINQLQKGSFTVNLPIDAAAILSRYKNGFSKEQLNSTKTCLL